MGLLLIALAALAQYTFGFTGADTREFRMEQTPHGVSYDFDANPSFHSNNSRFYFFTTRSGIRYMSSAGETRWPHSFSLTRPHMAARGDVVAVGETEGRGRTIHTFNTNGLMDTVNLDHPVLGFSVNSAGFLSAITEMDRGYRVQAFRPNSSSPVFDMSMHHSSSPMRFPIASEISENGRYIAVAYFNLYRRLVTEIEFFLIDAQETRFGTYALFAGDEFPDEFFITMRFMADNHLLFITDRRIVLLRIVNSTIDDVWYVPIYNRIDRLAFCGDNRFAFVSGAPLNPDGRNADPLGTVNIFDLSGLTGRFYLGRRATHLSMGHNAVIVGADRYFRAINSRGTSLWQHTATHDVRDIIFLDNTNTVLIAGPNRAYVWRRQRVRND